VQRRTVVVLKALVWLACLSPLLRLGFKGLNDGLGANPIEFITLSTGIWTLVFLLVTLSLTPLRRITGLAWFIRFRRLIGLFAFFYGCLHFTTYIWLDKFFEFGEMLEDVAKRPFITAGFLAFVLLIPLAATSTQWAIRNLGRKWQWLHRLVYVSAAAGVVHFWWKVKADIREPAIYAAILTLLLLIRLYFWAARSPRILRMRSGARRRSAGELG
jgi:sulfoxide reductase heme-binding subunit YedZ